MYLPLFFNTDGLSCLVVGGGEIASRKLEIFLKLGCRVTVVAPEINETIRLAVDRGAAVWVARNYRPGDCEGHGLVVAATPHREVNRTVSGEARSLRLPVNVVDDPELCSVIFPAVWRDGPLTVAVGTGGSAPFMAPVIRDRLVAGARGWGRWVEAAGRFREAVRAGVGDRRERNRLYQEFTRKAVLGDDPGAPDSDSLAGWIAWLHPESQK